ncbi:MAG: hypothetical protein WA960_12305 [Tunicatimonas sp.]
MKYPRNFQNWWFMLLLIAASCVNGGDDDDPPNETSCQENIARNWQVQDYQVAGQSQPITNVQVRFTATEYTLLLPEVDEFGSTGSWTTNDNCSRLTLDDGDEELNVSIDLSADGQLVLTFQRSNFKQDPVAYRITLVTN